MTIRKRLMLWYTGLLTVIIILLGVVVYGVMDRTLISNIDSTLEEINNNVRFVRIREFGFPLRIVAYLPQDFPGVEVQIWIYEEDHFVKLDSSENMKDYQDPFDPALSNTIEVIHNTVPIKNSSWRVRTSPLFNDEGQLIGRIQVAGSLEFTNKAMKVLHVVILGSCAFAIIGAAMLSMWLSNRVVQPIEAITHAASHVVGTTDLSTRLAWDGPMDELGRLNAVFNQMMARLEHLFSVQQRFVADVSHELRTPLTAICGNLELIKRYGMDDESLNAISSETDRMKRLVNDLLLLARADYGGLSIELMPLELDTLMTDTYRQARGLLEGRQLELRIAHLEPLTVNGNGDRLKQVLLNLIENALKFTPDNGAVTMSLQRQEQNAVIEISDTGIGISPKDLARIFDRFYQSDPSRNHENNSGGFGLGLSIAQWIVHEHKGRIQVASDEGKGTTFTITIPLLETETLPHSSHHEVTRPRLPVLRRNRVSNI